jgi:hypothetical protein
MRQLIDLTGRTFGRLLVLERVILSSRHTNWRCKCTCGQVRVVRGQSLRRGAVQSCGCWRREASKERMRKKRAGASVRYRYTAEQAFADVAAGWPASLAKLAQEALA